MGLLGGIPSAVTSGLAHIGKSAMTGAGYQDDLSKAIEAAQQPSPAPTTMPAPPAPPLTPLPSEDEMAGQQMYEWLKPAGPAVAPAPPAPPELRTETPEKHRQSVALEALEDAARQADETTPIGKLYGALAQPGSVGERLKRGLGVVQQQLFSPQAARRAGQSTVEALDFFTGIPSIIEGLYERGDPGAEKALTGAVQFLALFSAGEHTPEAIRDRLIDQARKRGGANFDRLYRAGAVEDYMKGGRTLLQQRGWADPEIDTIEKIITNAMNDVGQTVTPTERPTPEPTPTPPEAPRRRGRQLEGEAEAPPIETPPAPEPQPPVAPQEFQELWDWIEQQRKREITGPPTPPAEEVVQAPAVPPVSPSVGAPPPMEFEIRPGERPAPPPELLEPGVAVPTPLTPPPALRPEEGMVPGEELQPGVPVAPPAIPPAELRPEEEGFLPGEEFRPGVSVKPPPPSGPAPTEPTPPPSAQRPTLDNLELAEPENYYIYGKDKKRGEYRPIPVENAKPIRIEGHENLDLFLYKKPEGWEVSEAITGSGVTGKAFKTEEEAIDEAKKILDQKGTEKTKTAIQRWVIHREIMPRYRRKGVIPTPPASALPPTPELPQEITSPPPPTPETPAPEIVAPGGEEAVIPSEPAPFPVETKPETVPSDVISSWVRDRLYAKEPIKSDELFAAAERAYGSSMAEGKYSIKDIYDAMELGINHFLTQAPTGEIPMARRDIAELRDLLSRLPTQTKRTKEQEQFQQFSTPPHLGYTVAWAANLTPRDVVLEPSAGIGGLAVFAKNAGARTIVNELSPRRADLLKHLGFDQVFTENAEQLHNILPADVKPTVILMNPPFSSSAGRLGEKTSTNLVKAHLEQALKRLEENGRLVAIVGKGLAENRVSMLDWWNEIRQNYNVRANIGLPGSEYKKYGTTFDNQLLVIDKSGPTPKGGTVTDTVSSLEDALPLLESIRNDRPTVAIRPSEPGAGEPTRETAPPAGGGFPQPIVSPPAPTPPVGPGERGGAVTPQPLPVPAGQPGGPAGVTPAARPELPAGPAPGGGDVERPGGIAGTGPGGVSEPARPDLTRPSPGGEPHISVERQEAPKATEAMSASVYEPYHPQKLKIPGAKAHPGKLVQSAAMATVEPPDPTYTPSLPKGITENLSEAQLEAVTYAGQAHEKTLPDGPRRGFFIGDGTGVGKGREISGIILDNWNQGRTKAVWISVNGKLLKDALRDFGDTGGDVKRIFDLGKIKGEVPIKNTEGVLFTTYGTMKSQGKTKRDTAGNQIPGKRRLDQIVEWLGEDFDGVIVFDEAHAMANALDVKGARGTKEASATAKAGSELQKKLPNARIVYVSATGATDVSNLAYAERLGLWGRGTPFTSVRDFVSKIKAGGLAAMELVARDMKAQGSYIARNLSFEEVTYETMEHPLTPDQRDIYNELARSWQIVLQNVNDALKITNQAGNGYAKSSAMSAFWGSHQRFFNQIITSMQMPSVVRRIREDLAIEDPSQRQAHVLQLVNTNEAIQERKLATLEEEDLSPEDLAALDLTPRENLMQYIQNSFPTAQYEVYVDEQGNMQTRPVVDSQGNPVQNADAVAARDALLDKLGAIRVPEGPMEILLNTFGPEQVAEVTGRSRRVVRIREGGEERTEIQTRGDSHALADVNDFMNDKKPILVFSNAGGTGQSYHAALNAKNQRKRQHYLVQPGWQADRAVQAMGRTHRTNEASAPNYLLVTTDLKGQKRFLSSIARRLDQLGALTKGQRQTGSQGLFSARDNLESQYAVDAMVRFWRDLYAGDIPDMDLATISGQMGLKLIDDKTGSLRSDLPPVTQFLNRILSLDIDTQNRVFDAFFERVEQNVARAIANNTLDVGLETVKALKTEVVSEQTVYTDPDSGAETKYVHLSLTHPRKITPFEQTALMPEFSGYFLNEKSGRISEVGAPRNVTTESGAVVTRWRSRSPTTSIFIEEDELKKLTRISPENARQLWNQTIRDTPKTYTEDLHLITGTLLPIWDRLYGSPRIMRVQTDKGRRMLGRLIEPKFLDPTLRNLGASASAPTITPADAVAKILDERYTITLANGWTIKQSRVSGEPRIEVTGPDYRDMQALQKEGAFTERIQWQTRVFLPTGDDAAKVFEEVTKYRPVATVNPPQRTAADVLATQQSAEEATRGGDAPPAAAETAAPAQPGPETTPAPAQPGPTEAPQPVTPPPTEPGPPPLPEERPPEKVKGAADILKEEEGSISTQILHDMVDAGAQLINSTRPQFSSLQKDAPEAYEALVRAASSRDYGRVISRQHFEAIKRIVHGDEQKLDAIARFLNSEQGKALMMDPARAPKVRVHMLNPVDEAAILADPEISEALDYYKTRVQPIIRLISQRLGIDPATYRFGPHGFYMMLYAVDPGQPMPKGGKWSSFGDPTTGSIPRRLSRKQSRSALKASGAGVYSEDLGDMLDHMFADRFTTTAQNQLIETIVQRYRVKADPVTNKIPKTISFAGKDVPVVMSDIGTRYARAVARHPGMRIAPPLEDIHLPKPIEDAWRQVVLGRSDPQVPLLAGLSNLLTTVMVNSPAEATMHGLNVLSALQNAPQIGNSLGKFGRFMALTPARWGAILADIWNISPAEMDRIMPILAEYGGLRTSMYDVHGIPGLRWLKQMVFDYPSYGRGIRGLESRSRIALYRAMERKYPNLSPAEIVNKVNNFLGTYVPALQPEIVRFMRLSGLGNPFATATMTLGKTAVKGFLGHGPHGFSWEILAANWLSIPLALYLLQSILDPATEDRDPWDMPGWNPQMIRVARDDRGVTEIPIRYLFNSYARALRLTGLGAVLRAHAAGDQSSGELARVWGRQLANNVISFVEGPFVRAGAGFMGYAPYFTEKGLMPIEPPEESLSLGRRLFDAVTSAIPIAQSGREGITSVRDWIDDFDNPERTPNASSASEKLVQVLKGAGQIAGVRTSTRPSEREMASLPGRAQRARMHDIADGIARELKHTPIERRAETMREMLESRVSPQHRPLVAREVIRSLKRQMRAMGRGVLLPQPPQSRLPIPPEQTRASAIRG
jgi:P-loop containing NTP hydrolase pore-1/C-terminal domain on Strawberry notch homologue